MKNSSKKVISTICVLLTLCSVSAVSIVVCNASSGVSGNISSSVSSRQKASDYTLKLDSNPTTGYTWSYKVDNEGIIKETKNEYIPDKTEAGIVGSGGVQQFSFKGIKEGDVTVTFEYARSWDKSDTQTKSVILHVDANGNITEK